MSYEMAQATDGTISVTASKPQHARPVYAATLRIAKGLEELEERLTTLRDRLGPVMRPSEPAAESVATLADASVTSPHVDELQRHSLLISDLTARVDLLIDRLDV